MLRAGEDAMPRTLSRAWAGPQTCSLPPLVGHSEEAVRLGILLGRKPCLLGPPCSVALPTTETLGFLGHSRACAVPLQVPRDGEQTAALRATRTQPRTGP